MNKFNTIQRLMEVDRIGIDKTDVPRRKSEAVMRMTTYWSHVKTKEFINELPRLPVFGDIRYHIDKPNNYEVTLFDAEIANALDDKQSFTDPTPFIVGILDFESQQRFHRAHVINYATVQPKYQDRKIMLTLYASLIKKEGMTLITGSSQSEGGMKLWRALADVPGVFVYAWDDSTETAHHAFASPDDDDFDTEVGLSHGDPVLDAEWEVKRQEYRDRIAVARGAVQHAIRHGGSDEEEAAEDEVDRIRKEFKDFIDTYQKDPEMYGKVHLVLVATRGQKAKDSLK